MSGRPLPCAGARSAGHRRARLESADVASGPAGVIGAAGVIGVVVAPGIGVTGRGLGAGSCFPVMMLIGRSSRPSRVPEDGSGTADGRLSRAGRSAGAGAGT